MISSSEVLNSVACGGESMQKECYLKGYSVNSDSWFFFFVMQVPNISFGFLGIHFKEASTSKTAISNNTLPATGLDKKPTFPAPVLPPHTNLFFLFYRMWFIPIIDHLVPLFFSPSVSVPTFKILIYQK